MDLNAMTTLLGDAILNVKEEEYYEACQHTLKSPYEARTDDKNDEGGGAPSDDDEGTSSEDDNSGDSNSDDSEDSDDGDNSSDESDSEGSKSEDYDSRDNEDEDAGAFYEDNSYDDVDYYEGDIDDDVEAISGDYDEYLYRRPLDWSCITDASSKSSPQYDRHGKEILKLGSFHNLEFGLLTVYTDEEDDVAARLATLDKNLMIHNFRNLTLEDLKDEDERMEGSESEYFPQYVHLSNKGRQDLFGEWMDSIELLDGYAFDKPTDMEVDGESPDYTDEDPRILMLKEEGTHWEPTTIIESITELKN
ncbi:hypothetical protein SO802_005999 [Lithocarpus litseifolius]|uniref:Uncharacterized protein n=1 Tax=Lithocarpus litseifolius TaxID=425828 RepID=A0AAW2DPF2_9ROSI